MLIARRIAGADRRSPGRSVLVRTDHSGYSGPDFDNRS
jgi:hypothetical protein